MKDFLIDYLQYTKEEDILKYKKYLKNKNVYTKYEKLFMSIIKNDYRLPFIPTHYFTNTGCIYPNWLDYKDNDNREVYKYKRMMGNGKSYYPNRENKKFYCRILYTHEYKDIFNRTKKIAMIELINSIRFILIIDLSALKKIK